MVCVCVCVVKHPSVSAIPVQNHPVALSKPGPITAPEQSLTHPPRSPLFISSLFANFNLQRRQFCLPTLTGYLNGLLISLK